MDVEQILFEKNCQYFCMNISHYSTECQSLFLTRTKIRVDGG